MTELLASKSGGPSSEAFFTSGKVKGYKCGAVYAVPLKLPSSWMLAIVFTTHLLKSEVEMTNIY